MHSNSISKNFQFFNIKENLNSQLNKSMQQNIDAKNMTKKAMIDNAASKCYMLNEASLGIHCTRIPRSMEISDVVKFFNVYGEIDSIGYESKKGTCDILYYDIRSSIAAFIALQNYSFDKKHILRINFIGMDYLKEIQKTSFVILKLINDQNGFVKKYEIEEFARSYGDFHLVEPIISGCFIIYFYDSRQCNQCISKSHLEFDNKFKYAVFPYYKNLYKPIEFSKKSQKNDSKFELLTTKFDEFNDNLESGLNDKDFKIYVPIVGQQKSFHCKLFISLFNRQASNELMNK